MWFFKKYLARCGHKTKKKDKVTAFGETITTEVPLVDGKIEYCHKCLEKMAIRCAWCGKPIFIGDPVTLYSLTNGTKEMPKHAVCHDKKLNQYVGCLRCDCADTGADRAGFWVPPGVVERIPTPYEILMADSTKKCIII
jgi:hypothetical protein